MDHLNTCLQIRQMLGKVHSLMQDTHNDYAVSGSVVRQIMSANSANSNPFKKNIARLGADMLRIVCDQAHRPKQQISVSAELCLAPSLESVIENLIEVPVCLSSELSV